MSDYNDGLLPDPCLRIDTHFGDEYESVEFGDGTGYVKAAPILVRLLALHAELDEMRAENAKLREELAKARKPQRIGGQANPSSFVYAIEQLREFRWQHATNDEDAIPYINNVADAHDCENAKLKKLLSVMAYCNQFRRDCDGCSMNGAAGIITERAGCDELLARLREVGVEVKS